MFRNDKTTMGGQREMFQTTCWTEIVRVNTTNEGQKRLIVNSLIARYWRPVYCYLIRKGYQSESAKDLTQGFFADVVLGRSLLNQASAGKGKFRTFLLTALDRYTTDIYRRETAEKRKPKSGLYSLGEIEPSDVPSYDPDVSPEDSFNQAWVADILEQVFAEVKQECIVADKQTHWRVFQARVVNPVISGSEPMSLPEICKKYGIESEKTASNMIITVKRRLRKALERHLVILSASDSEIEQEIIELKKIISK